MHAIGQGPAAKLAWCHRLLAKFERGIAELRRDNEGLTALGMKVGMMEENEILARQMAAAAAEHAARDEALERRLAEAEAALEKALTELRSAAGRLSRKRATAARKLERAVAKNHDRVQRAEEALSEAREKLAAGSTESQPTH